jgi:hypothetical protein
MPEAEVDLAKLFNTTTKTLKANQAALNEADVYNHNHGDNMVKNFQAITKAVKKKKGAPPSEQLNYASQVLSQSSPTGSAALYSQGLSQAAQQLEGQPAVNSENAMSLVQALMGGGAAPQTTQAASDDVMGQLLGSLMGGGAAGQPTQGASDDMLGQLMGSLLGGGAAAQPAQGSSDDVMGQLLGSLLGGAAGEPPAQAAPSGQGGGGINLNTLLTAGLAYMQASQQGASTSQALINALMAGSQMNDTPYHAQSGQLVTSTLISAIGSMLGGKKR